MNFFDKLSPEKAVNMNPIVLAFIGDAVYSLYVREKAALKYDCKSGKLNEITAKIVQAKSQAKVVDELMPYLSQKEIDIFKRGRNAKKPSHAKNATIVDYNKSTGFEAILGYLYATGDEERLNFILNFATSRCEQVEELQQED